MKYYNINKNIEKGLGQFADQRGTITDMFYARNMNHGCIITNAPGAVRGTFVAGHGDMIISEPGEIHAMRTGEHGCTFLAFAEGPRGGEDYESDTYRVDSIII
jgi:hypothetical protein